MKISLEKLYRKAADRPPGYLEDVIAAGILGDDGFLEITLPDYQTLVAKYQVGTAVPAVRIDRVPLGGAGDLVAKFAQPIARAIDRVAGTNLENCGGCKQRQAKLNAAIPFPDRHKPAGPL